MSQLINSDQLQKITGLSLMTINRLEKKGIFPKRIKISKRNVRWSESDLEVWFRDPEGYGQPCVGNPESGPAL